MKAIVDALNIIYDEDEKRGLIWLNVVSLFFTICAISGAGLAIALVVVSPFAVAVAPSRHQGDHNVSIRYQRSSNVHCDWFSGPWSPRWAGCHSLTDERAWVHGIRSRSARNQCPSDYLSRRRTIAPSVRREKAVMTRPALRVRL